MVVKKLMQYVTEFWKITLMGVREIITITNFTMVTYHGAVDSTIYFSNISQVFLARDSKHFSSIETIKE